MVAVSPDGTHIVGGDEAGSLTVWESYGSGAGTEPDAFRWIQKTAMDLRLSMREVADGVVEHGVEPR